MEKRGQKWQGFLTTSGCGCSAWGHDHRSCQRQAASKVDRTGFEAWEGRRCNNAIISNLLQRQEAAAEEFEMVTLPMYPEGLVHFRAQLVVRGWGPRRHSERRRARARAVLFR